MKKIIALLCSLLCLCFCISVNAEGLVAISVTNHVSGYIGLKIEGQLVDIKLDPSAPDATFTDVEVDDDVTDWFTNIPKGLYAKVNEIINNDELKVEINGVVDSSETEGSTKIAVTIPEGYIKYGVNAYPDALSNEPSNSAKYKLETFYPFEIQYYDSYVVEGEVGEELEPQDVVVEIVNCGSGGEDFDYENIVGLVLPTVNGLTPTVTDYDEVDLTITITYTGTPIKESHDLIHTTIPKEYMVNATEDTVVPDRDDVLFNIVDNTPHIEPKHRNRPIFIPIIKPIIIPIVKPNIKPTIEPKEEQEKIVVIEKEKFIIPNTGIN